MAAPPHAEPLAITGLGVVSAAGAGVAALAELFASGASRIGPLPDEVARGLSVREGGRVTASITDNARAESRALAMCRRAAAEALADAAAEPAHTGLALGTALAAIDAADAGLEIEVARLRSVPASALARALARGARLRGPLTAFSATCASSLYALEQAAMDLSLGRTNAMLVGGVDTLGRFMQAGFCALGALAPEPGVAADGLRLGEAAAFVVAEPLARARARGARVHAIILGRGVCTDGLHLTSPDEEGRGMTAAIDAALLDASLDASDVSWVSTTAADAPAYRRMYESVLRRLAGARELPAVSWEPAVGHVLAATGAFGIIDAALRLRGAPRDVALALTVGFGGQNGALALGGAESVAAPAPERGAS